MLIIGALTIAFTLYAPSHSTAAVHNSACLPLMMAKQNTGNGKGWSIGKARKKGVKKDDRNLPSVAKGFATEAKGFGAVKAKPAAATPAAAAPSPAEAEASDERMAPADLNANDIARVAAEAGGETWRSYAAAALAQVEALEAEASEKHISAQELLARQSAMEEAKAQRAGGA